MASEIATTRSRIMKRKEAGKGVSKLKKKLQSTRKATKGGVDKFEARLQKRKAAGKGTKTLERKMSGAAPKSGSAKGIGKSGAGKKVSTRKLVDRTQRRKNAGKGTKRVEKSRTLRRKLDAATAGGNTKRATRLKSRMATRAAGAKARRTARKAAK